MGLRNRPKGKPVKDVAVKVNPLFWVSRVYFFEGIVFFININIILQLNIYLATNNIFVRIVFFWRPKDGINKGKEFVMNKLSVLKYDEACYESQAILDAIKAENGEST